MDFFPKYKWVMEGYFNYSNYPDRISKFKQLWSVENEPTDVKESEC